MDKIAPDGPIYQAGTLSGNPIAVSAGTALLKQLKDKSIYKDLEKNGKLFLELLAEVTDKNNIPFSYNIRGGMFGFFFSKDLPKNFEEVNNSDLDLFSRFFQVCFRKRFIYHLQRLKVVSFQLSIARKF